MRTNVQDRGYAGDKTPTEAWEALTADPGNTFLVDVRTVPEWQYVGLPDLGPLGAAPLLVSWQLFPGMETNSGFADQLAAAGVRPDSTLLFLCRSGARSKAAAIAMTARGYGRCYNVSEGFEGGLDERSHRGTTGGWKAAGLPWKQT